MVDARFVKPLDGKMLAQVATSHRLLVTLEDNATTGGLGGAVLETLCAEKREMPVLALGAPDAFIPQASVTQQLEMLGLTPRAIAHAIYTRWKEECASMNG